MKWNNAQEYALFREEQKKLREEYLAAGMTEEQIKAMYKFDLKYLNLRQREARHTQELDISAFDDEGDDEAKNPLYKKFLHCFAKEDKHWEDDRFGWIEEIESKKLYKAIKALPDIEKEMLTDVLYIGLTQKEMAEKYGVNQSSISRRLIGLKNFLKKFL